MKASVNAWVVLAGAAAIFALLLLHAVVAVWTRRWVSVRGLSFEAKTSLRKTSIAPEGLLVIESVAYQYEANGAPFRGTQCYALGALPFAGSLTQRFLEDIERARKNGTFTVFVAPNNPARAVLRKGMPWELFALFGFILLLACLTLGLVMHNHPHVVTATLASSAVSAGTLFGLGAMYVRLHLLA
jgi:hypothetical protein